MMISMKEINSYLNKRMIKSLNKAKFIIANSKFTKKLANNLGVNNEKIYVINPGSNYPIEIKKEYDIEAKKIFGNGHISFTKTKKSVAKTNIPAERFP